MKTFAFKIDPLTGEEYYEVYVAGPAAPERPAPEQGLGLHPGGAAEPWAWTACCAPASCPWRPRWTAPTRPTTASPTTWSATSTSSALQDRSETLFYRLLAEHLKEMVPIVYTPTVGQACLQMSHIQRRFRGIYITPENIGQHRPDLPERLPAPGEPHRGHRRRAHPGPGRPGLRRHGHPGRQGEPLRGRRRPPPRMSACRCASTWAPTTSGSWTIPLYLGYRHPRLRGRRRTRSSSRRFVLGVKRNFPDALLQWEDFAKHTAFKNLERYRDRILSFNDDIQGTGATALAALMTAMRIKKQPLPGRALPHRGHGPGRHRHRP